MRISITLALLIFLFKKTDFTALFETLKRSDAHKMSLAFLIFVFLNILALLRWHLLLKGLDIRVKPSRLLRSYLSSLFFNLVFPSTLGGDTVRTLDIAGHTKRHSSGILATVILDRLSGFFGLMTVLVFSLIFGFGVLKDSSILVVAFLLLVIMLVLSGVMFSTSFFNGIFKFLPFKKLKEYLAKIHESSLGYKKKMHILIKVWFLSIIVQGGVSVMYYLVAEAIGVRLNFIYFFILVPVVTACSVIPISIGGLGVRDTASVVLFGRVGVMAEEAFALSLLNFGFMFVLGVLGGIAYVYGLYRRRV